MSEGLAQSATHLSTWIVGMVAGIYFLQMFETELKPLVVAFVFVSILEAIVQLIEWLFQKLWTLLRLLLWKLWLLLGLLVMKVCRCQIEKADREEMWDNVLCNWGDLFARWQGSDAGRHYFFRILAVLLTLFIVVLLALLAKSLVEQEITSVISKFDLYKHQVTSMANTLAELMPELVESVPRQWRNQTVAIVTNIELSFDRNVEELPDKIEGMALWTLNMILATSSARLMDLAFFLLYSAFMLFDPLHINLEDAPPETTPLQRMDPERSASSISDGWFIKNAHGLAQRLRRPLGRAATESAALNDKAEPLLDQGELVDSRPPSDCLPSVGSVAAAGGDTPPSGATSSKTPPLSRTPPKFRTPPRGIVGLARAASEDIPDAEQGAQPREICRRSSFLGTRIHLNELQYYIYKIVWNYFLITVVLNVTFASAVFALLTSLGVDLAMIISFTCFFLSFIPELGAILSAVLPVPCILLTPTIYCHTPKHYRANAYGVDRWEGVDMDCVHDVPLRLQKVVASIVGMILIKLVVSNLLSAYLMGRNRTLSGSVNEDDKEVRETHGVIVLFAVVFFGKVWGIVGMLISVPILSIVRLTFNMGSDYHRQKAEAAARREREQRRSRSESPIPRRRVSTGGSNVFNF